MADFGIRNKVTGVPLFLCPNRGECVCGCGTPNSKFVLTEDYSDVEAEEYLLATREEAQAALDSGEESADGSVFYPFMLCMKSEDYEVYEI